MIHILFHIALSTCISGFTMKSQVLVEESANIYPPNTCWTPIIYLKLLVTLVERNIKCKIVEAIVFDLWQYSIYNARKIVLNSIR